MNKSNTPPFYVGEEVEYITGNSMPKGTKVFVTDIWQYPCGCWGILHNYKKSELANGNPLMICSECFSEFNHKYKIGEQVGWAVSSFRRLQRPKPMTFVKLAEIIEQEKEEVLTLN